MPPRAAGLEHLQQPSEQQQFEADDGFNNTSQTDVLEDPSHSLGRIPRPFEDVPPADEDANYSNNVDTPPAQNAQSRIRRVLLTLRDTLQTNFNSLGLSRLYPCRPSVEPDECVPSSLLSTTCPTIVQETDLPGILPPPYPFPNMTIYRLMSWMNIGSSKKSEGEVARLVEEVILADDFDRKHLEGFSVKKCLREMDHDPGRKTQVKFPDDWIEASVTIKIPTKLREDEARPFSIPGFHFRPLIQDELQKLPKEPGCSLERIIAGLMFFLDATHLANFGTAKAWPLYMYFGNLTEYARSAPKSGACHLVGFFPSLPDRIKDVLSDLPRISKSGMAALHTHCRRELFHGCWDTLLDTDFLHSYCHGIVLKCADGVFCRIFPRIFTYSADYPEKVLIATMKDMGLVKDMRSHISNVRVYVETNVVKAQEYIYQWGNTVDGTKVQETLGEGSFLDSTFKKLSRQLQKFCKSTCAAFDTSELPKEKAARQRWLAKCVGYNSASSASNGGPRVKKFNLNTYKFHAMGDYTQTIKFFGTTDSFTTQIGELAHRAIKVFYPLTCKLDTPAQLEKHERQRRVLRQIKEAADMSSSSNEYPTNSLATSESLIQDHHSISTSRNNPISLFTFLQENDGDPVIKNFIPRLKDHILYRLKKLDVSHCDHTFTDQERKTVIIPNNTVYSVQTMQIHYTTYDMRCEYGHHQPKTHGDVMVLSGESAPTHPYWYARILGIYHMDTWLEGGGETEKQQLEVLHVRWLAPLMSYGSGMQRARLPKVAFIDESDHDAFRFLDPGQVIRGTHLIPTFTSGRGSSSLRHGKSLARRNGELDDWEVYYVGMASFVDHDMFLRYTDLGRLFGLHALVEAMDVDEGGGDGEDHEEADDEQPMDVDLADEESEGEHNDIEGEEESDDGFDDLEEDIEYEFDELSFRDRPDFSDLYNPTECLLEY
ncbi:hypothetical protein DFJ58DRAFT_728071 [Suillus subalutaceus]|uniref:uncharacterized protein n=1 Tax=Suillus subalutaceus TaxID=48586 RepID=UPI001B867F30|nr:uncharacterized protein DFJ58DRAFT_728071 [Suillus subalutaceus]KAG1853937.1 hypothetical protein DFJ58DRAFT_728071 [Suillus subalutaceus]